MTDSTQVYKPEVKHTRCAKKNFSMSMTRQTYDKCKTAAKKDGRSLSSFLERAALMKLEELGM